MEIREISQRSKHIRETYHQLEVKQDGTPWTSEQDALAFLTDAGIVGRLVMNQQGSWPTADAEFTLDYKIAECIWWLSSLADENKVDLEAAMDKFLTSREKHLN